MGPTTYLLRCRGVFSVHPEIDSRYGCADVPIRDLIADRLDKAAYLINDANAAALAEYHFGAGRNAHCFIYVTVSTGIGGGVVMNGDIYTGGRPVLPGNLHIAFYVFCPVYRDRPITPHARRLPALPVG